MKNKTTIVFCKKIKNITKELKLLCSRNYSDITVYEFLQMKKHEKFAKRQIHKGKANEYKC